MIAESDDVLVVIVVPIAVPAAALVAGALVAPAGIAALAFLGDPGFAALPLFAGRFA